jgi:hypothetical protein
LRTATFVVLVVGLLSVSGCQQATQSSTPTTFNSVGGRFAGRGAVPAAAAVRQSPDKPESLERTPVPTPRKLIRNGTLTLNVESVESALATIRALVQSLGGYISNESQSSDDIRGPRASLMCRVPAEKLDTMLARVKSAGRASEVTITAEDITEQYYDLDARLRNQKQLEARLVQLLSRPSNDLADLLSAERELARVRYELDSLEGKRRLWDNQVTFSTLIVNILGSRPALGASEGGFAQSLKNAVTQAGENFVSFVTGIIALTGWLVPLVVVLWIAVRVLKAAWRFTRSRWRSKPPITSQAGETKQ